MTNPFAVWWRILSRRIGGLPVGWRMLLWVLYKFASGVLWLLEQTVRIFWQLLSYMLRPLGAQLLALVRPVVVVALGLLLIHVAGLPAVMMAIECLLPLAIAIGGLVIAGRYAFR
jgi:hypothetical protein